MKVAILADPLDLQSAGIHQYTYQLVNALNKSSDGHEYLLVRTKAGGEFNNMEELVIPQGIQLLGKDPVRLLRTIPAELTKRGVDVVVETAHFGPFNLPAAVKRVTMIHDLTPILFPDLHPWHRSVFNRLFQKRILKKADLILANSDHTQQDIEREYPFAKGKVKRIYLAADPFFQPIEDVSAVAELGIRKPFLLHVGTIEPRKNLERLLEAFAIWKERSESEHQLVLVGGSGWKSESFYAALQKHPFREHIVMAGFVSLEMLRALYSAAELFVYPSLYEGFGLPVLEAMSCGCPALISNRSSLPEVGGDAALTVDPTNVSEIASQMESILSDQDRRKNRSEAALKQAEKFSWESHAREFEQALDNLG